jgi:hypothetical protein
VPPQDWADPSSHSSSRWPKSRSQRGRNVLDIDTAGTFGPRSGSAAKCSRTCRALSPGQRRARRMSDDPAEGTVRPASAMTDDDFSRTPRACHTRARIRATTP